MKVVVDTTVEVIKVESATNEFRIIVKKNDPELTREYAVASELSAIASELSAVASELSELVSVEAAAESLASKIESESAAATSTEQAILSASARNDSEAAKLAAQDSEDVSTQQATISTTKATESAASAAAAAAIVNGGLSPGGSIPQVELLQNKDAFKNNYLSAIYPSKQVLFWDNFDRPNGAIGNLDSGQVWENLVGTWTIVNKTAQCNQSLGILGIATTNLSEGIEITANISGAFSNFTSIFYFIKDLNNFMSIEFINGSVNISQRIGGVTTLLSSYAQSPAGTYQLASITAVIQINAQNRTITAGVKNYSTIAPPSIVNYSTIFTGAGHYGYGHNQRLNARGQLFTILGRRFTFPA
jgi:hypothetical protein